MYNVVFAFPYSSTVYMNIRSGNNQTEFGKFVQNSLRFEGLIWKVVTNNE